MSDVARNPEAFPDMMTAGIRPTAADLRRHMPPEARQALARLLLEE